MSRSFLAEFKTVTKAYGASRNPLLGPVSFGLHRNQITVFLGPNGAGKSTTFKLLLGLREPTSGSVSLFGRSPRDPLARAKVGYTSQDLSYPAHLSAKEILSLVGAHFENPVSREEMCERFQLEKIWSHQLGGLSGGEKRRVGLACALMGQPELLVLDEPTTGLDVDAKRLLWQEISRFKLSGGTVLLSTHDLTEAGTMADRVLLIDGGLIKLDGTMTEILEPIDFKKAVYRQNGVRHEHTWRDSDTEIRNLVQSGIGFEDLEVRKLGLEEALEVYRGKK